MLFLQSQAKLKIRERRLFHLVVESVLFLPTGGGTFPEAKQN